MPKSSPKLPPPPRGFERSSCPIACTLEIIGDKWTLLVIRDLLLGKKRYGDFQNSPEAIPTNILAERLKRLEAAGLVIKKPYQDHPVRHEYALTEASAQLEPIIRSIAEWGNRHIPGTYRGWPKKGS